MNLENTPRSERFSYPIDDLLKEQAEANHRRICADSVKELGISHSTVWSHLMGEKRKLDRWISHKWTELDRRQTRLKVCSLLLLQNQSYLFLQRIFRHDRK
ncbi:Histone-lysine N-methyltransferase SETMAR [Habropoda laboriosa]|uniref:Histone-lysine N-methyltransferase SETMAR n=1 Tax=Habropoda laboriosa TaxID=597456 RepID=A0A0L7QWV3_9HYME|nr:Histone-lysine N-methyltransferase SETMAR [Habropoda laboriosa]